MSIGILRLVDLNLVYKIQELMEDYGFQNGEYNVVDGYPNFADSRTSLIWPTISVEISGLWGRDVELGSGQWPAFQVAIDIFANTDSQRDEIAYMLWNNLNEENFTLYDFNIDFPSSVGDYSGISAYNSTADYYIAQLSVTVLSPIDSNIEGERHRALLDGIIYLPNV